MKIDKLRQLVNSHTIVRASLYPMLATRRAFLKKKHSLQMEPINNLRAMLHGDIVVRLDDLKGIFTVDPRSDLFSRVMIGGNYEPKLIQMITRYIDKKRDVIDVGANVGFYTIFLAKTVEKGRILAVEPTSNALKRLRRNIEMNDVGNKVEIFEGVASKIIGLTKINTIIGKEEYSSLGKMKHSSIDGEKSALVEVMSTTLDALVEEKSLDPGFLKVDVEGAEHLVFQGAQRILSENRPVILSELSDALLKENGASAKEVIDMIKKHDYDVIDPITPASIPGSKLYGDILCFPKEMKARI